MAPRTVYANLQDGLQPFSLWDQSLADMGSLGIIPCTASGTNTIVLTPIASAFAPNVLSPPQQLQAFSFVAAATSTGSVTINGLKLYKEDGATQASTGDIVSGVLYGVFYNSALNSSAGGYQITFPITSILNPVISGATITNSTITTSTYNGLTVTATTGTLTIAAGKTETFNNTLTFAGTDGTTMTFPTTSATIARTDAGNTFTGHQTIEGVTSTGATGTGNLVFATSPSLTTPTLGAATATTLNGNTFTTGTYTLTGVAAKTLTFNNSLTLAGTDGTTLTFPTTNATIARTDAGQTFTGTQNLASLTASSAVATDGSKNLVSVTNTGSGNNVLATSPTISTPVVSGRTDAGSASAGNIGETIKQTILIGSAVNITPTGTTVNIATITLTAGNWLIWAEPAFTGGATTTVTGLRATISTTSATENAVSPFHVSSSYATTTQFATFDTIFSIAPIYVQLSGSQQYWLTGRAFFGVSTCSAYGTLIAMRVQS